MWSQSRVNYGSILIPAVFWSQILMVLSWEDVATWAAPPGGTGRNTQEAVVWMWPLYSTTLQPGWRRSQSWPKTDGQTQAHSRVRSRACRRNTHVLRSSLESSTEPKGSKNWKEMNQLSLEGRAGCLLFKIVNVDTQYWKEQLKMQLNVHLFLKGFTK